MDAVEELGSVPANVKPEEIKLAKQVIGTFDAPLNLGDYKAVAAKPAAKRKRA